MNEDVKKKFNEKFKALVGEEQLDKVAGGSYQENLEILNAIAQFDFDGVKGVFDQVNASDETDAGDIIRQGAEDLLDKHFAKFSLKIDTYTDDDNWYRTHRWENISHKQILDMIKDKAKTAQDFVIL